MCVAIWSTIKHYQCYHFIPKVIPEYGWRVSYDCRVVWFCLFSASGSVGDGYLPLPGPPGVAHPWGYSARGLEGRGLLSQT